MKVNVIKEFVDKHTGELHKQGSSFDCDANRYEEILKSGAYVVPAQAEENEQPEQPIKNKKNAK